MYLIPRQCPRCSQTISSARDDRAGWCRICKDWTLPDIEDPDRE